jgi:adenylosuccinate synthase
VSSADEHVIVVDLGYGDAGKGRIVDRLCADADAADRPVEAVIRFNGGAQAAHNVVTADGRHHTFAQFGSGTLQGVRTHLSRFVVVDPLALTVEADHLRTLGVPAPFGLVTVDAEALLATPWHRAANQARERERGAGGHGTCGMGVGETVAYALAHPEAPRVCDARDPIRLRRCLAAVRDRLTDEFGDEIFYAVPVDEVAQVFTAFTNSVAIVDGEETRRKLLAAGQCVFEGAQGVLLDEWFGWHPHTTWSTTTFENAATLLAGLPALRLGVVRTYTTRHGAGPHVTEDRSLDALPEPHNAPGLQWAPVWPHGSSLRGPFRRGHFDAVAHRYAVEVAGGVDALAVTHLDAPLRVPGLRVCTSYQTGSDEELTHIPVGTKGDLAGQERLTELLKGARPGRLERPTDWAGTIGDLLGAPVVIGSHGPRTTDGWVACPSRAAVS